MQKMMERTNIQRIVEELQRRTGSETEPTVTEIGAGAIRKFALAVGDPDPLYVDENYARHSRFGGIVAPPTFVCAFTAGHFPEIVDQNLPFQRMLHSEDAVKSYRLMRPGDVITAFARYVDAYSKEGTRGPMVFQAADLILKDAAGERVAEVRITTVSF
jgi:acyl dehydratase